MCYAENGKVNQKFGAQILTFGKVGAQILTFAKVGAQNVDIWKSWGPDFDIWKNWSRLAQILTFGKVGAQISRFQMCFGLSLSPPIPCRTCFVSWPKPAASVLFCFVLSKPASAAEEKLRRSSSNYLIFNNARTKMTIKSTQKIK